MTPIPFPVSVRVYPDYNFFLGQNALLNGGFNAALSSVLWIQIKRLYFQLFLVFPGMFGLDFPGLITGVSMNFCCCRFNLNQL